MNREYDFQIACAKLGPDVVIGGLSALFYYNLCEQIPKQTWVLVSPHKITSGRSYRLIRTQVPLDKGIVVGNGYPTKTNNTQKNWNDGRGTRP